MAQGGEVKSSIVETHPQLCEQWHPTKNGELRPENFTAGSGRKVWWKCPVAEDHEWETTIFNRSYGNNCPYCSGRIATSTNNLTITHPKLVAQWHPTKNGDLKPENFKFGSQKKVWWKCSVYEDHEWKATIKNRATLGNGCACCRGFTVVKSNCLSTTHPEIAVQWHSIKNGSKKPENYR